MVAHGNAVGAGEFDSLRHCDDAGLESGIAHIFGFDPETHALFRHRSGLFQS
jgi:hypothetical protein